MKTIFKVLILLLITSTFSNAELLNPNSNIKPKEVIKIQLNGLQQNDSKFKDSFHFKNNYSDVLYLLLLIIITNNIGRINVKSVTTINKIPSSE